MSLANAAVEIAKIALGAGSAGLDALEAGKTRDEALMAMVEHVQNQRAKEKFAEFEDGGT